MLSLWVAIDADTEPVPSFMTGNRDAKSATMFIDDLASHLASRVQLTSDGLKVYLEPSKAHLALTSIMRCSLRPTRQAKKKPATARLCAYQATAGHEPGVR